MDYRTMHLFTANTNVFLLLILDCIDRDEATDPRAIC